MTPIPDEFKVALVDAGEDPNNYIWDAQHNGVIHKRDVPGFWGTVAKETALGALPSVVTALAATGAGSLAASRFPEHPLVAGGVGAIVGGIPASMVAEAAQNKALEHASPEFMAARELGREAHPYAAALGNLIGSGAGFGSPMRGLRSLGVIGAGKAAENAGRNYLLNTGLQGALNFGTAALTGNLDKMSGEEKAAMALQSLAGGLQHGGYLTRALAAKYAPKLYEYMKSGDATETKVDRSKFGDQISSGETPTEGAMDHKRAGGAEMQNAEERRMPMSLADEEAYLAAPEYDPPGPKTPEKKALIEGKKRGIIRTLDDIRSVRAHPDPMARLEQLYHERLQVQAAQQTPEQREAQARQAFTKEEIKAREDFKKQLQSFNDEYASLDEEIKLLDETPIPPGGAGTRWAIKQQKLAKQQDIAARQAKAEADYAARWPQPEMPLVRTGVSRDVPAVPERPMLPAPTPEPGEPHGPAIPMDGPEVPPSHGPAIPLPERLEDPRDEALRHLRAVSEGVQTPLSPEAKAALQGYAEGEQGHPFGDDSEIRAEPIDPRRPMGTYSGFPIHEPLKELWAAAREFADKHKLSINPLDWPIAAQHFTRSIHQRFAELNPYGAYVAAQMPEMFRYRNKVQNTKIAQTEQFKDFLGDDRVKKWLNAQTDARVWDPSSLPAELRKTGEQFVDHIRSYIDEMKERGQKIMTSRGNAWVWRDPEHVAGHFPWAIDRKVYGEITEGGAAASVRKKQWMDNWKKWNPDDAESIAEETFNDLVSPISAVRAIGGEPVFNQFRKAHGVPIPPEWRDQNVYDSLQTYNRNYGVDAAWTEFVQKDPLMRAAFGIKRDHQGRYTYDADKKVRPTKDQWKGIFREVDRYGAKWGDTATPDMELGNPLLNDRDGNARMFLASYSQRMPESVGAGGRAINNANQLAGAMMLQTASGVRDLSQAMASTAEYALAGEGKEAAIKALAKTIAHPFEGIEAAKRAGAMQEDVFSHQGEEVISRAVYKAIRGLRGVTGRKFADELGKAVAYNVAHDTVMHQLETHGRSPLAEEFGPVKAKSKEELAAATATAIVERTSPSYDARNLPPYMMPQSNSFLSHLFRLSTWGVARYNNWIVDSYMPMVRSGSFERFIKSVGFGVLGAAATQSLLTYIKDRKPADLTWQEWMGLSTEEQQKEFAPMLFALIQAQGTMGIAGDLASPLVDTLSGKTARIGDLSPQMPVVIMGKDALHTAVDFYTYAGQRNWNIDKYDLIDLTHELAQSMQLYRDLQKRVGVDTADKEAAREQHVYEQMTGRSPTTGAQLPVQPFRAPDFGTKFSLSKSFNTRTGDALRSLMPDLVAAAKKGQTVAVKQDERTRDYYKNLIERLGYDEAKAMYERDRAEVAEDSPRKQIASRLRSLRPATVR